MNVKRCLATWLTGSLLALFLSSCGSTMNTPEPNSESPVSTEHPADATEQFADLRVLHYEVPGFDALTTKQKELLFYLSRAGQAGRDITYDQNYRNNLVVRRTLENVYATYEGDRNTEAFRALEVYLKRVWFSNGIHHHYSTRKFDPGFTEEDFRTFVAGSKVEGLPTMSGEGVDQLVERLTPILFDPTIDAKRVNKDEGADLVADSANNFYEGVTQQDVEAFYAARIQRDDPTPISHGLNSKLVKRDGELVEETWKVGGMYDAAITQVVSWLEKASAVAENDAQKKALDLLIAFYRTGDLATFDRYSIAWVEDTQSLVDVVNGFIEVYGDAMGYRATFESVVSIKDLEASKRIAAISDQAQWFEDHSPILPEHRKERVQGISAKVILAVMEGGDCSPATPIGINLPNANWIRAQHGSKSVNLGNIVDAYDRASKHSGMLEEFCSSEEEIARAKQWGTLASNLHTDMHEVIGHASGQIEAGIGTPKETLKAYGSTLEEARADLVALYYLMDPKLIEIGVMSTLDVGRAAYDDFVRNGLLWQLRRIPLGETMEEDHMRNRQLIAKWVLQAGAGDHVIERVDRDDKTFYVIRDYDALRELFGQLLREIQRIESQGDYAAGKALVEAYGVSVEHALHEQVLQRAERLGIAPYSGFINPRLTPVLDDAGAIVDVRIDYDETFAEQHMRYSREHSFLPNAN